jgi:hypothetical protein
VSQPRQRAVVTGFPSRHRYCRGGKRGTDPPTTGPLNSTLRNSANLRQAASRNSSRDPPLVGGVPFFRRIGTARQSIGVDIRTRDVSCP